MSVGASGTSELLFDALNGEIAIRTGNPGDLYLDADLSLSALREIVFEDVDTIIVTFDDHTDGRGFSVPPLLRSLGFDGRLIAAGYLLPDQLREALQVGFDGVLVPSAQVERHGMDVWTRALSGFRSAYSDARGSAVSERAMTPARVTRVTSNTRDKLLGAAVESR